MDYALEYLHEILDQFINPKKRIFFIYIFMSVIIGLLWLRQEVKSTVKDYWINFKKEWPNENTPE